MSGAPAWLLVWISASPGKLLICDVHRGPTLGRTLIRQLAASEKGEAATSHPPEQAATSLRQPQERTPHPRACSKCPSRHWYPAPPEQTLAPGWPPARTAALLRPSSLVLLPGLSTLRPKRENPEGQELQRPGLTHSAMAQGSPGLGSPRAGAGEADPEIKLMAAGLCLLLP